MTSPPRQPRPPGRRFRRRRGSVLIQVGIALPVLMLGIVGVMETGRVLWARNTLQFATEETARFAMINNVWNAATLTERLQARLSGIDPAKVTVTVTPVARPGAAPTFVGIRASMPQSFVSFLGINAVTISGYARVPVGS
jgi:Flp pilus assembly protein TadG